MYLLINSNTGNIAIDSTYLIENVPDGYKVVEIEDSLVNDIDTETLANEYSYINGVLIHHDPLDPTLLPNYVPPLTGGEVFEALVSVLIPDVNIANAIIEPEIAERMTRFYPEWEIDHAYIIGYRVQYDGFLYKCLQAHTSQEVWNPADATSLWARMLVPDSEIIPEWEQPISTNPYMKGDKVLWDNKIWVSDVDNNVWMPGIYGWSEIIT